MVLAVLGIVLAGGLAWLLIGPSRKAREQGTAACVAKGHDAEFCEERADLYHQRCMDITYDRGGRYRPGAGLDADAYVECLELGDREYWSLTAKRAEEQREAQRKSRQLR